MKHKRAQVEESVHSCKAGKGGEAYPEGRIQGQGDGFGFLDREELWELLDSLKEPRLPKIWLGTEYRSNLSVQSHAVSDN